MSNSAPGFRKYPEHKLATKPAGKRVTVKFKGELIADSRDAIELQESTYAPVHYLPRKDVRMERFTPAALKTHCPFKGNATHFGLAGGPEIAAWSYEQPYDEMAVLKDRIAFYPEKVDAIEVADS